MNRGKEGARFIQISKWKEMDRLRCITESAISSLKIWEYVSIIR